MTKRLLKRHKRQVSRAKAKVKAVGAGPENAGTGEGGTGSEPPCRRPR